MTVAKVHQGRCVYEVSLALKHWCLRNWAKCRLNIGDANDGDANQGMSSLCRPCLLMQSGQKLCLTTNVNKQCLFDTLLRNQNVTDRQHNSIYPPTPSETLCLCVWNNFLRAPDKMYPGELVSSKNMFVAVVLWNKHVSYLHSWQGMRVLIPILEFSSPEPFSFFFILQKDLCCGYTLEVPQWCFPEKEIPVLF